VVDRAKLETAMPPVLGKGLDVSRKKASFLPSWGWLFHCRLLLRLKKTMKRYICFLLSFLLFGMSPLVNGENLANDKLLEFLQQNGFLTKEQVSTVKELVQKEEAKTIEAVYDDGIHIRTRDKSFDARIGGLIQADYVTFGSHYPIKSDFDIRRARILLTSRLFEYFNYKLEAELEGASSSHLVDAYMNFSYFPAFQPQVGQFKEPFSLENLISDKDLPFTERSMAYYLTPARDVGFMIQGNLFKDAVNYGIGIFNGDGVDAYRRSQKNDKEIAGRVVFRPFSIVKSPFVNDLQIGGSFSYHRLTPSDLNFEIKTAARTTFFSVKSRAKYNVIQNINSLRRFGFEMAYPYGPFVMMGEFIRDDFKDAELSDTQSFDFSLKAWYVSSLYMITGEKPVIKRGILERIMPKEPFDIKAGKWGAWGLALRYEQFEAGENVYDYLVQAGYSVRKANALTFGLNWYLNNMIRLSLDYSRTWFAQPLFLGTSPEGYSYYVNAEDSWFTRFQFEF
jgi:phosphate-selective porin OprO/OprP